ncbi:hypothetical protein F4825DRAFT_440857 [Nemania diffusa]|nr:hypothetical protein F4825DRAFT_440857 [Nemania diffusa]
MEAVGAVAATAQLVGMAMKTLELIANLHSIIKDVSARYEDWNTKLTTLEDLIRIIQGNPSLQTQSVERAIASMSLKVENLIVLCTMHVPRTGSRGLSKLLKCLTARAAEPRIHQSFQSLEQDKTSLLLVINASEVHTWKPEILPPNPPEDNQENQVDASPPSSGSSHMLNMSTPAKKDKNIASDLPAQLDTMSLSNNHRQISSFQNLVVSGARNAVGTSTSSVVNFDGARVEGYRLVVGSHTPRVFRTVT